MTDDTWLTRDLPVHRAAVEFVDEDSRGPRASAIESELGFDEGQERRIQLQYNAWMAAQSTRT